MNAYTDSVEHLRDELARLDLLLQRALLVARKADASPGADDFRGLVISEPEIDALVVAKDFFGERWRRMEASAADLHVFDERIEELRAEIDARRELAERNGVWLALPWLGRRFGLSPAEVDVLLLAVAPELEPNYETLYAYLQNDVTRKHPSVDLALNLICRSEREKLDARRMVAASSTLLRYRLLDLGDEPQDRNPSLLRKYLRTDESMLAMLLGQLPVSDGVATFVEPSDTRTHEVESVTTSHLERMGAYILRDGRNDVIVRLTGNTASLREGAETLCRALGKKLLLVDLARVGTDEASLSRLMRNAALSGAVLGVGEPEAPANDAEAQRLAQRLDALWSAFRVFREPVILLGPVGSVTRMPADVRVWTLAMVTPGFNTRRETWEDALGETAAQSDPARLADTFRYGGNRIHQTIDMARSLAAVRDPDNPEPGIRDLLDAGRSLTAPQIAKFAIRVEPRYTWSDIVLPQDKTDRLRGIATWMKYRRVVHREWGFGEKVSRGKGLNVLFTGPSGTGKTMAAEVLAGELALDLYQIDLSSVVSKYIGETEKNLSAIFGEAEQSQALLFFDEADALFGKRTEVKDAHDRYANIEVNYLLQRVEQFEGVVILATNLQQNLDDAFLRRMQEVVEFPFPDEVHRARIWRAHFPSSAPRDEDIDFAFLARQFKLTGGNIKNIVMAAAFLAAQESKAINMSHLIFATKSEHEKEGKLAVKSDFGPFYEMIKRRA